MSVSKQSYLASLLAQQTAMGAKAINSDAFFIIDGFENEALLTKQFPWPVLSPGGEIEVPGPMGTSMFQPQQVEIKFQGAISFMETRAGHIDAMLKKILDNGGIFSARCYEGSIESPLRTARITNCFMRIEALDRDIENRAQILMYTGTLFGHYVGEA